MAIADQNGNSRNKPPGLFSKLKFGGGKDGSKAESRFEVSIQEMHKKFSPTVISRMQILNLNSLIVRRDIDLTELIKKAEIIALGVIEDNLGDKDAYVHNDVGVYGFLFSGKSLNSAQLKSQVIADQIARLINDADPQFLNINLEFEASTRKRRGSTFAAVVAGPKKPAPKVSTAPDSKRLRELENQKAMANLAIQQMTTKPRGDGEGLLGKAASWWAGDDHPRPGEKGLPENIDTIYRAMWNVKNKLLTAYSALSVLRAPDGRVESVVRIGLESGMYAVAAACDRLVQEEALRKLHLLLDAGHKVLLVLPVHFSTVDRYDYFVPYQQRLRNLNDKQRQLVVPELVGLPPDLNSDRIRESVTRLRQVARSVMARVTTGSSSLRAWRDAGVHAVGLEFNEGQVSESALLNELDRFAGRADEAGLKKFVYGLATRSAASAAVAAGFDYIEGSIVRPPVDQPAYVEPFESIDLFAGFFRR